MGALPALGLEPRRGRALMDLYRDVDVRDVSAADRPAHAGAPPAPDDRRSPVRISALPRRAHPGRAPRRAARATDHALVGGDVDQLVDEIEEFLDRHPRPTRPARARALHRAVHRHRRLHRATRPSWATGAGASCSDRHDRDAPRDEVDSAAAVARSRAPATASWPPSTARPARSTAPRAVAGGVGDLGLQVRAGVHTGECELRGDDIGGMAVHIGARVAARAEPGEVLVSEHGQGPGGGLGPRLRRAGRAGAEGRARRSGACTPSPSRLLRVHVDGEAGVAVGAVGRDLLHRAGAPRRSPRRGSAALTTSCERSRPWRRNSGAGPSTGPSERSMPLRAPLRRRPARARAPPTSTPPGSGCRRAGSAAPRRRSSSPAVKPSASCSAAWRSGARVGSSACTITRPPRAAAAAAARQLAHQRERALLGAEVGEAQRGVGVEHHARASRPGSRGPWPPSACPPAPRRARARSAPAAAPTPGRGRAVGVQAHDGQRVHQVLELAAQLLGARAVAGDRHRAAVGAGAGHRARCARSGGTRPGRRTGGAPA